MPNHGNNIAEIFKAQAIMQSDNVIFSLIIFAAIDIFTNILKEIMAIIKVYIDKQIANLNKAVVTALPTVSIEEAELFFNRPFKNTSSSTSGDWDRADAILHHALNIPLSSSILVIGSLELVQNRKRFEVENGIDLQINDLNIDQTQGVVNQISFKLISKTKNICQLREWVNGIAELYIANKKNGFGANRFYFDQIVEKKSKSDRSEGNRTNLAFTLHKFTTNRTLDNVFHDRQKEITDRVNFFLNNQDWYNKRGIPYTFGMLLYGPPGTGKTSTIKAIANESDRHIININLGAIKTRNQLKKLFYDDRIQVQKSADGYSNTIEYIIPIDKRVYVLEDFDASLESKFLAKRTTPLYTPIGSTENKDEDNDLDLATLLNVIDGTLETPGRILILTSNHPEMIDEALIRPGRIDLIIEYGKCSSQVIVNMWTSFYGTSVGKEDFDKCQNIWTPAQVGQILFRNFNTPEKAKVELTTTKPFTFEVPVPTEEPVVLERPTDNTLTPQLYKLFLLKLYESIHGIVPEHNSVLDILLNKPQIPVAHAKLMFEENRELTEAELVENINLAYRFQNGVNVPDDFEVIREQLGYELMTAVIYNLIHTTPMPKTYTYEQSQSLTDHFQYIEKHP